MSFLARPIAPWSRLTYWNGIRQWCQYLRDFDHIPSCDLLRGIPKPKTPDALPRPIDEATIHQLLSTTLSPRAHAYVRLALFAGLRVHEVAKVRSEDLDLAAGWMTVHGKGGRTAAIPIHPEVADLAEFMPRAGYWFPSSTDAGEPVSPVSVSKTISSALRSVGSSATAHQLRDTAATRLQRQVKDIRLTQALLRHKSVNSTMKYVAVSDAALKAAVDGMHWGAAA